MAQVLLSFEEPVSDELGSYRVRALGRTARDGMWEGWLEFLPVNGGGEVLVSAVESRQPQREHLVYWATGLTPVYLQGALDRARYPREARTTRVAEVPISHAPAVRPATPRAARAWRPDAILNPFDVGARNLRLLEQELGALDRARLLNIIAAYDLNRAGEALAWMTDPQLVRFIVVAVEAQLLQRSRWPA